MSAMKISSSVTELVMRAAAQSALPDHPFEISDGKSYLRFDAIRVTGTSSRWATRGTTRIAFLWRGTEICHIDGNAEIGAGDQFNVSGLRGLVDFTISNEP